VAGPRNGSSEGGSLQADASVRGPGGPAEDANEHRGSLPKMLKMDVNESCTRNCDSRAGSIVGIGEDGVEGLSSVSAIH